MKDTNINDKCNDENKSLKTTFSVSNCSGDIPLEDINSNGSLLDDNVNTSLTSDDSGIFSTSSSTMGIRSAAESPSTPPEPLPIYAATNKEANAMGETFKPQFNDINQSVNRQTQSSGSIQNRASSPCGSDSSSDSSMLDMISRAAIYDEIFKLDD